MRSLGYTWGVGGVLLLLVFAIYRLAPMAFALNEIPLTMLHWAALLFSICYMAYAEGYKGFHLGFAPRVVSRASYLSQNPRLAHIILAPLFCMGYFHTTRKRQLLSIGLTVMIICFILIARQLPQPWRGILDAGVVVGLGIGIASINYFLLVSRLSPTYEQVSAEVPGDD
ncbi:MAG: hypothetical protein MI746_11645 [Pseudomonadales bacterium]|nr:hypothetical protein [Pseudomonadales bacterium]